MTTFSGQAAVRLRRGGALASVLMIATLILVVGLALASLCLFNLNLSAGWMVSQQSYQMAQAAIQQVLQDVQNDPNLINTSIASAVPDFNFPVAYPPGYNILGGGAPNYPGTVTTDFTAGANHYSTDNLSGGTAVAGWRDGTSGSKSVPPYTVDLILKVTIGGHVSYMESLLQRRWPYVLTTTGNVDILGTLSSIQCSGGCGTFTGTGIQGSSILGKSLLLNIGDNLVSPSPTLPPASDIVVPARVFEQIEVPVGGQSFHQAPMDVGAAATPVACSGNPCTIVPGGSYKNQVVGRVDLDKGLMCGAPPCVPLVNVFASPLNTQTGGTNILVNARPLLASLQMAVGTVPPAPGGFANIPTCCCCQAGPRAWGQPMGWKPPSCPCGAPTLAPEPFYIFSTLSLSPTTPPPGGGPPSSYYVIQRSAGNTMLTTGGLQCSSGLTLHSLKGKLTLTNCTLRVDGNLDLDANATLTGTNASLIVNGTLLLDGGTLNAGGQGMVIWCQRLVCAATGTYQGLIVARDSALFVPPPQPASCGCVCSLPPCPLPGCPPVASATPPPLSPLTIQGAVVAGQQPQKIHGIRLVSGRGRQVSVQGCGAGAGSAELHGLLLLSTNLTYDPRYMANLNRYGQVQALSLDVIP